jgi:hypothetical protein
MEVVVNPLEMLSGRGKKDCAKEAQTSRGRRSRPRPANGEGEGALVAM